MTTREVDARGVPLQVTEIGSGPPLLFLHGLHGLDADAECFALLAEHFRVLLPVHPGFGLSPREPWCNTVHDLAYLYLDLLAALDLREVHLVGSSFGGWVAAEMAVRSEDRLADLVLIDPLGIKVNDRWTRDITDIFATHPQELVRLAFHVPPVAPPQSYVELSDDELLAELRNAEASAVYGWEPFMHDPKLRRLLGRITVPTLLVWGASDGIVKLDYGRAYQEAIPNAELVVIDAAAHYPHVEQPHVLVKHLDEFFARNADTVR
jgi:pimeloyl-ACP methyl ester carboxylesterase